MMSQYSITTITKDIYGINLVISFLRYSLNSIIIVIAIINAIMGTASYNHKVLNFMQDHYNYYSWSTVKDWS